MNRKNENFGNDIYKFTDDVSDISCVYYMN